MRMLVDVHDIPWEEAWQITQATFSYTNHTLLPEALESWPVPLLERLLPRHMQIIYLINALHLDTSRAGGHSDDRAAAGGVADRRERRAARAHGHTSPSSARTRSTASPRCTRALMRETVFHDLNAFYPGRIINKTNGITFRRWLLEANPGLTSLLIGRGRPGGAGRCARRWRSLPPFADDAALPGALRGGAARQQGGARRADRRADADPGRSGRAVRRADQAHSRIQAPAAEHPARRSRSTTRCARSRCATGCRA